MRPPRRAAALLVLLLTCGAPLARAAPPGTVSPQAQAMLQRFAAAPRLAAPPAPGAKPDWDARQRAADAFIARLTTPVVQALQPTVSDLSLSGVPALKVVARGGASARPILIYVHGGAYTAFSAHSTLASAAAMADAAKLTVYSVDYTLAPRGNWRTATDQVIAAYRALLHQGHRPAEIGMFGDSAGGGLVAGAVLKMRDQGVPLPAALELLSPWTDVTGAGDSHTTLAASDPVLSEPDLKLSADAYAAPADQRNPYVSPVYGNYAAGFPPTLIQGGTREIFLSDFVREYRAITDAGGQARLDLYEGMPHVFQNLLYGTPEAVAAYRVAARFWRDHLSAH